MARVALPQSKIRAKRKKRRIVLAAIVVGILLALLALLSWISHLSFARISVVEVEGTHTISKEAVVAAAHEALAGSYLYLFPRDNIFLYPKFAIQHALTKKIPTLASVEVRAVNFQTLKVTVKERARKALWCGNIVQIEGACFWLDSDGSAYSSVGDIALALNSASSTYERYYGELVGTSTPKQYLTRDGFRSLSALVDAIAEQQKDNYVVSVAVERSGTVRMTFKNDFTLIFNLDAAGADVYQRFILALGADVFVEHSLSEFSYLDLRFGDKLYYKLK